jgi:transposase
MVRSRKGHAAQRSVAPGPLPQLTANAAGIDVGGTSHFVVVPPDRDGTPVREFRTFTGDLYRLAEWLTACGIETVAMESTGVYWIPLFQVLEARGFTVKLVDAHQLKQAPGRKSDVLDCQWLQQLHSFGLLAGAFRPDDQLCVLRSYLRQRAMLATYAGQHGQHMQKALVQMNLQLQVVLEDITGATGRKIIRAVLAGERDPHTRAALRDGRCKHSAATIAAALQGDWRAEHLFALEQAVELVEQYQAKIAACDARIQAHLQQFPDRGTGEPPAPGPQPRADRHDLRFDATAELYRVSGVDLTAVPGLQAHTVLKVLSEIGLDMTRWPSAKHFGSWLGLAPNNRISGGKILSRRTKPTANRAAAARRVAAQSLHRSKSALGAFLRRKAAHLGMPKAITATAYTLARSIYSLLSSGHAYVEPGQDAYELAHKHRAVRSLSKRARDLGFDLVKRDPVQPLAAPA